MELKENNTYIIQTRYNEHIVYKGKVIELTETTTQITNLDNQNTCRYELNDFKDRYEMIELITDHEAELEKLISGLATSTPLYTYHDITPQSHNMCSYCNVCSNNSCFKWKY